VPLEVIMEGACLIEDGMPQRLPGIRGCCCARRSVSLRDDRIFGSRDRLGGSLEISKAVMTSTHSSFSTC